MSWYWKRKPTWRKDLITYNSHPWICLLFIIWLSFEEEGEEDRLKLNVQGQGGGRILDVDGQGGGRFLKIRQFPWTSYVYHPLFNWVAEVLTHLFPVHLFSTPWKHQKTWCFQGVKKGCIGTNGLISRTM